MKISGYAALFDAPYQLNDNYFEVVDYNAFTGCDFESCCLLYDHNTSFVLGRINEKLTVTPDRLGLKWTCSFPETQTAADVLNLVQNKILTSCSWGFQIMRENWTSEQKTGLPLRHIERVKIVYDVSIVPYPANPSAKITSIT